MPVWDPESGEPEPEPPPPEPEYTDPRDIPMVPYQKLEPSASAVALDLEGPVFYSLQIVP